ncbi:hypothetical protein ACTA71_005636 [Dictyostelium dimigraforme]
MDDSDVDVDVDVNVDGDSDGDDLIVFVRNKFLLTENAIEHQQQEQQQQKQQQQQQHQHQDQKQHQPGNASSKFSHFNPFSKSEKHKGPFLFPLNSTNTPNISLPTAPSKGSNNNNNCYNPTDMPPRSKNGSPQVKSYNNNNNNNNYSSSININYYSTTPSLVSPIEEVGIFSLIYNSRNNIKGQRQQKQSSIQRNMKISLLSNYQSNLNHQNVFSMQVKLLPNGQPVKIS